MEFDTVVYGLVKYFNKRIIPGLNDWQTLLARTAVARLLRSLDNVKGALLSSKILQTFAVIDSNGRVDIDGLAADLKAQIKECPNEKVIVVVPIFGKYTFSAADIDELHSMIKEGNREDGT